MQEKSVVLLVLACITAATLRAAPVKDYPVTLRQPDGTSLSCLVSGDEFYSWYHDSDGFTIMRDPGTGWYVYAQAEDGRLYPTQHIAGRDDPHAAGLLPHANISEKRYLRKRTGTFSYPNDAYTSVSAGMMNNLTIFIRFAGESNISDPLSYFDSMFNGRGMNENSMYRYFQETSYGSVDIETHFYPMPSGNTVLSFLDQYPRSYYQPYDANSNPNGYRNGTELRDREHALLDRAITYCRSQIPSNLNIDVDNDGRVDNIVFIINGDSDGWAGLLWPHKWALYSRTVYLHGKRVYTYNLQLVDFLKRRGNGVLCHEMFHTLGAPDLYHYSYDRLEPTGVWDIMSTTQNPPQHMGAYMKHRYGGWITSIPTITTPGTYSLSPQTNSSNNAYRINSPYSTSEYFVVEYRRKQGVFESSLPSEGLLVYRINTARDGKGNRDGPPDEVYIYRPGGSASSNGNPSQATFNRAYGRTVISDVSSPSVSLSDGSPGGIIISNVSDAGATISFDVNFAATGPEVMTDAATNVTATSARLEGRVKPNGSSVAWYFEYGESPSFGSSTTMTASGSANAFIPVSADVQGLRANATYYYRCAALGAQSPVYGATRSFQTSGGSPQISVIPQSLDFGTVFVGNSRDLDLTIINNGQQELEILGTSVEGPHASLFQIHTSPQGRIAPQQSTSMRIRYNPASAGSHSATLRIASNDPSVPQLAVALRGTGDSKTIVPLVRAVGSVHLCQGKSVTLIAEEGFASYEWSTGEKTQAITVREGGSYLVTVKDYQGRQGTSDPVSVYAYDVPTVRVDLDGPTLLCNGEIRLLDAGPGYRSYSWNTGDTTRMLSVDRSGLYYVTVTTEHGCTGVSQPVPVAVLNFEPPVIQITGSTTPCSGDTVILDAGKGYSSYLWSDGSRDQLLSIEQSGTYSVRVENEYGCSDISAPVEITFRPAPEQPTIDRIGDMLVATNAYAHQWYRDGTALEGETNQFIRLTETGSYAVEVANENGCAARSDKFVVEILPVNRPIARTFAVEMFPNPVSASLRVRIKLHGQLFIQIQLVDILGRTVRLATKHVRFPGMLFTFDVLDLPAGSYYLQCRTEKGMTVQQVRIQHN